MLRGVIFDLDGTLVDSRLDFAAMRREMELPAEQPILEAIAALPPARAARCHEILHRHERAGAERAVLLAGAAELLAHLRRRCLPIGVITRNSRAIALASLHQVGIAHEGLVTRDDGPVKPDPWGVFQLCQQWNVSPEEVVLIGDYRFDVEAGRAAGARTVLLTVDVAPHEHPNQEQADLLLHSLADYRRLLAWLESL